jgi:hypothetical protein
MTLTRTAFLRRLPDVDRATVKVPKPAKGPRMRRCKVCRSLFAPRSITHKACGEGCALVVAEDVRKAQERKSDRARKLAIKPRAKWLAEAQQAFNAFIRARDATLPCICCGRTSEKRYLTGTNWDCGHYRSTGSAPHMRFNEDNAHRQLTVCNRHGAGRAVDYRIGLIVRIGLARVEALECDQAPCKWSIEELQRIKAEYKAKLKNLQQTRA